MTYVLPYTEADVVSSDAEAIVAGLNTAQQLLREAYGSGQLRGTIIGEKLRDYFGSESASDLGVAQ
jgi:hypothetical protein